MKNFFLFLFILFHFIGLAQVPPNFFGGFESNSQWYLNDESLKNANNVGVAHPDYPLQSNNYLNLNYRYNKWTMGIQAESYQDRSVFDNELLNLNPGYKKTNIGTYFIQYKNKKIDLTAGYFYEQFGSGLLFRAWEDRALGINNALRGGRIIIKPNNYMTIKSIYGQQRSGFNVSDSKIYGADIDFILSNAFDLKTTEVSFGLAFVGRDEKTTLINSNFNNLTTAFGGRISIANQSFYGSSEIDFKSKDAIVNDGIIKSNFIKPGSAVLINLGYSQKGFGIDATFRRLENMSFFSERTAKGNTYNDKIMNFIPSLTKQQHYNLANIYVYQSQPSVLLSDPTLVKAGEIGGQIDMFYNFKKGTALGGKTGTKVAINIADWSALGGTFIISSPQDYQTDFIGFGKKYYTDYNIEIEKKWNSKWQSSFSFINQYYNKSIIDQTGVVNTNTLAAETTCKMSGSKSFRFIAEHLWADSDKKNWAASTFEFITNSSFSMYLSDMYNYGNDKSYSRNHYYNLGAAYRKNATRIAVNYGRQRGGLLCVGGICRVVPESSGVSLSLNTSF
jgi:Family of unknown function (DUF6029)